MGNLGERIACEYLVKKGYKILGRNWKTKWGEIDIIAQRKPKLFGNSDKAIHFVEVKTIVGSGKNFFPEEHVDFKKQRKLKQLAEIWLNKKNYRQDFPYQIDIIGVLLDGGEKEAKVSYFPNAVEGKY